MRSKLLERGSIVARHDEKLGNSLLERSNLRPVLRQLLSVPGAGEAVLHQEVQAVAEVCDQEHRWINAKEYGEGALEVSGRRKQHHRAVTQQIVPVSEGLE